MTLLTCCEQMCMSVVSDTVSASVEAVVSDATSGSVERCSSCPKSRDYPKHRYWTWNLQCHLQVHWHKDVWQVSFVDNKESMADWMHQNVKEEQTLFFDCEWSRWDKGIGLIQFATRAVGHRRRRVLIVDCTKVESVHVRKLFCAYRMVGWATDNDVKHLEEDEKKRMDFPTVIDLQLLVSNKSMYNRMRPEDMKKILAYEPMDKNGHVQEKKRITITEHQMSTNEWSLNDMAGCFLGYKVKVQLKKPRQTHRGWSNKKFRFKENEIHYAANDVIALAYLFDKLDYIYEQIKF